MRDYGRSEAQIRADERALIGAKRGMNMPEIEAAIRANGERIRDAAREATLTDLRGEVERLRDWEAQTFHTGPMDAAMEVDDFTAGRISALERVLELIDGDNE